MFGRDKVVPEPQTLSCVYKDPFAGALDEGGLYTWFNHQNVVLDGWWVTSGLLATFFVDLSSSS